MPAGFCGLRDTFSASVNRSSALVLGYYKNKKLVYTGK